MLNTLMIVIGLITKRKQGLLLILIGLALGAGGISLDQLYGFASDTESTSTTTMPTNPAERRAWVISPDARTHILYGDERGGGHLHGTGKPCKSEFPANWNEEKIITAVGMIATNDNLDWRQEDNGYYVTEQNHGRTKVRVVKDRKNERVITAYPITVKRNPCPRPANDNN